MKKTLLATAIAGALGVSAVAQAATVYDQDGTQVDVYGRLNFGITTGGVQDGAEKVDGSEFVDVFSRFGFRARHQVSSDLNVFANMEFRPKMDSMNRDGDMQVRNTFVGLQGDSWGRVQIGNFDGVVYQAITGKYEFHEYEGFTTLSGGATAARGDSIAYSTPNLEGFQAHVQGKHLSGNGGNVGEQDNSSTTTWQSALTYEWNDLHLGLGYNQSKQARNDYRYYTYDGGGANSAGEDIWLGSVMYNFTPAFTMGLKYEEVTDLNEDTTLTDIESLWTLMAIYDYGMGEIYADYNRVEMADDDSSNRNMFTIGGNYRFSKPMYVWAEIVEYDFSTDDTVSEVTDDTRFTVGVRYDF